MAKGDLPQNLSSLEDTLHEYFGEKAPQLPSNVKEAIVKYSPWLTLIILILSLPAVLVLFGIGSILAPFSYLGGMQFGIRYTLSLIILAVSLILEALAIPGLMKRSKNGWNMIFYSVLVSIVSNIISFNIGNLIIGALLPFYLLFQVRSYYK